MCATLSVSAPPQGASQIQVLVAERTRLASQLLGESLERDSRFRVVAVPTPGELLLVAANCKPHVALISADLDSAPRSGLHVARILNARQPDIHIAILLDVPAREHVIAAFRAGASAVFCRDAGLSELRNCIERVSRGEIWASNIEAEYLLEAVRRGPSCDAADSDKLNKLSKRELEVAEWAVQGHTNRQIADQLRLSEHTVKNYLFRAFEKLGVSTRMELLFLLSNYTKDSVRRPTGLALTGRASPMQPFLKAAEDGSVTAQVIVGMAHFEGYGVERDDRTAYYWLRMAEENSSKLQRRIRGVFEELRGRLSAEEIETLERHLVLRQGQTLAEAHPPDFLKADPDVTVIKLKRAGKLRRQK